MISFAVDFKLLKHAGDLCRQSGCRWSGASLWGLRTLSSKSPGTRSRSKPNRSVKQSSGVLSVITCAKPIQKQVAILGTDHWSAESAKQVHAAIKALKPDAIAFEIDPKYLESMKKKVRKNLENTSSFLRVRYGAEMTAALSEALQRDTEIICLDRDAGVFSLKMFVARVKDFALSRQLPSDSKTASSFSAAFGNFYGERLNLREFTRAKLEEHRYVWPNSTQLLVDARDEHMTECLLQSAAKSIVAVVGIGHMDGIESRLLTRCKGKLVQMDALRKFQ